MQSKCVKANSGWICVSERAAPTQSTGRQFLPSSQYKVTIQNVRPNILRTFNSNQASGKPLHQPSPSAPTTKPPMFSLVSRVGKGNPAQQPCMPSAPKATMLSVAPPLTIEKAALMLPLSYSQVPCRAGDLLVGEKRWQLVQGQSRSCHPLRPTARFLFNTGLALVKDLYGDEFTKMADRDRKAREGAAALNKQKSKAHESGQHSSSDTGRLRSRSAAVLFKSLLAKVATAWSFDSHLASQATLAVSLCFLQVCGCLPSFLAATLRAWSSRLRRCVSLRILSECQSGRLGLQLTHAIHTRHCCQAAAASATATLPMPFVWLWGAVPFRRQVVNSSRDASQSHCGLFRA